MNFVKAAFIRGIFKLAFEKFPLLNKLNGYKSILGAALLCLFYAWKGIYPVLAFYFPEIISVLGSIDLLMGQYIQFVADVLVVFGVQHRIYKAAEAKEYEQRIYS